jgi:hypothetical protein
LGQWVFAKHGGSSSFCLWNFASLTMMGLAKLVLTLSADGGDGMTNNNKLAGGSFSGQ